MKTKLLATLLGGLLSTSFAMASTAVFDYTLLTSDNLAGKYSIYDSGLYSNAASQWLSSTGWTTNTTASVLGTYQNSDGQWFQTTQFLTTQSITQTLQDYTETRRDVSFYVYQSDQQPASNAYSWVDLSVNVNQPMSYSLSAYGATGSVTAPRTGLTQVISPVLGAAVDSGTMHKATGYESISSGSWSASESGVVSQSFQAVAEATNGGTINSLYVGLSANRVLGNIHEETYSYTVNQWTQNVAIAAPVPEPETYGMMLAGLGMMGAVARRRKQNKA